MEQDNVLLAKERLKNQHDKMKIGMQILLQQIIETHIIKKNRKNPNNHNVQQDKTPLIVQLESVS